jgi:hypothetical protein
MRYDTKKRCQDRDIPQIGDRYILYKQIIITEVWGYAEVT